MSSSSYDIVLLPTRGISQKALELSAYLEKYGTFFTLDEQNYYPHLSLYMLQLNKGGLLTALDLLSELTSLVSGITAKAHEYHYSHDYLDVEYTKTHELEELQKRVILNLNPLRDGLRENDKKRLETSTGEERENILKYGYRSIGPQFAPHLTFTRFRNTQPKILSELPPPSIFSGTYTSLGIFEMGDHGTCTEPVRIWKLK